MPQAYTFARSFTTTGKTIDHHCTSAMHLASAIYEDMLHEVAALHTLTPKQVRRLKHIIRHRLAATMLHEQHAFYTALAHDLLPSGQLQTHMALYQWAKRFLFHNSTATLLYHLHRYTTKQKGEARAFRS